LAPALAPSAVESGFREAFAPDPAASDAVQRGKLHFGRPEEMLASANDWVTLEGALASLACRYGEIRAPVELVVAGSDGVVGPSHGEAVRRAIPQTHTVVVPNAGHQLPYTHPAEIVAAIERALSDR
jgi:pimeloyl-ACP methyl ester carboxylesterase